VLVGSSQPRLPAPFGLANRGLVAYSSEGDIFVVDPSTNERRSIVSTLETDLNPQWSRDGTRIVFERRQGAFSQLFTVQPDGSNLIAITPERIAIVDDQAGADYSFSPDGRTVLFVAGSTIQVARVDGAGVTAVQTPEVAVIEAAWRPPDGAQIAALDTNAGVYLIDPEDGIVETIVPPFSDQAGGALSWSPDGTRLTYTRWNDTTATSFTVRPYLVDLSTHIEQLADPAGQDAFWEALPTWSNDGRRLAVIRGYADGYVDVAAAIVNLDGRGGRIETPRGLELSGECCASLEWAPDDSTILWRPVDASTRPMPQLLIDPLTGAVSAPPWNAASDPAWQRVAP
jgi:Tol biopolymer transport system component